MYEQLAWNNFYKTGNIESFIEYKKINEVKQENEGKSFDGLNKSKRNNN